MNNEHLATGALIVIMRFLLLLFHLFFSGDFLFISGFQSFHGVCDCAGEILFVKRFQSLTRELHFADKVIETAYVIVFVLLFFYV